MDSIQNSISAITIPLVSSQPILSVSSKYILVNEHTKKRKQLVVMDANHQAYSINLSIQEPIIESLWYEFDKKFLLLTEKKIYTFDPNEKSIKPILDIRSIEGKPFKTFTMINKESSLLIAYDEWEPKFIDKWQQDKRSGHWKLIDRLPLSIDQNEFIGIIQGINEENCLNLVLTIYNNLKKQWRMEIRGINLLTCLRRIPLPGSDLIYDYRMLRINNNLADIQWFVYTPANNEIIAIDSQWQQTNLKCKYPIYRMIQFKENNLIIRTRNRMDIHLYL